MAVSILYASEKESKMTTETFGFWRKVLFKHKQIPLKKELGNFWEKVSVGFRSIYLQHTCEI